jgi:predicted ABC-type ATPase
MRDASSSSPGFSSSAPEAEAAFRHLRAILRRVSVSRRIIIIAGPNGAGKTTFAREFLPAEAGLPVFVNADLIAAGLSPFDPDAAAIRAGRLMLQEIDAHAAAGRSFAFETTLAGRSYVRRIETWRNHGYLVELIFLSLPSAEEAIRRVAVRVRQGGHHVAEDVIRRRFAAGMRNFRKVYRQMADYWILFDNSASTPRLIEEGKQK